MDKDQFCEAYKNNTDNLAVKIKMAYVEKRTREQVDVCHRLEAEEKMAEHSKRTEIRDCAVNQKTGV